MARFRSSGAYGFALQRVGADHYRMHWIVDRYYSGNKLRYPRVSSRDTDLAGAVRFARKHKLAIPEDPQP